MKKILVVLMSLLMVFMMIPEVSYAENVVYKIDVDKWDEFFGEIVDVDNDIERKEEVTSIVFGKKTDYVGNVSGVTGVSLDLDNNIKGYYANTVCYILSESGDIINLPDDSSYLFSSYDELTSITFSNISTSNVVDMDNMFYNSEKVLSLDLSCFDFSNCTDISFMFECTSSLNSITFPTTVNLKNDCEIEYLFHGSNISYVDFTGFSNITDDEEKNYGILYECENISSIKVKENFDIGLVLGDNAPTSEENKFSGWYKENTFNTLVDENTVLTSDTVLYAKWEEKKEVSLDLTPQIVTLLNKGDEAEFELLGESKDLQGFEIEYTMDYYGSTSTVTSIGSAGVFDVRITRNGDNEYKRYDSGVITGGLSVKSKVYYDANGATEGEAPTDDNIYSYGDEITIKDIGNLKRRGYTFSGWWTGSSYVDPGDTTNFNGGDILAIWELVMDSPTRANDYTCTVDTDDIKSYQWVVRTKDKYYLTEDDYNNDGVTIYQGNISGGSIISEEGIFSSKIELMIDDTILDIGDTATIKFSNLPADIECEAAGEDVTILNNEIVVTASSVFTHIKLQSYSCSSFKIESIYVDGTREEKLKGETTNRINNIPKKGQYILQMDYHAFDTYGTHTMYRGYIDSYGITFDSNGYSESFSSLYTLPGRSIVLPSANSKITNYEISWNTKADGTGESYKAGYSYPIEEEDITLYAIAKKVYQDPVYEFSSDYTTCTATKEYIGNSSLNLTETVNTSVEVKDGKVIYKATFNASYFSTKTYEVEKENIEIISNDETKISLLSGTISSNVKLSLKELDEDDEEKILSEINEKLDGEEIIYLFDLSLNDSNGDLVSATGNTYGVTITIPEELRGRDSYKIIYVKEDLTYEIIEAKLVSDKELYFETTHFSNWGIVSNILEEIEDMTIENTTSIANDASKPNYLIYIGIGIIVILVIIYILKKSKKA